MNFDISQILEHWDYQPGHVAVRKFKGKDGVEKVQLRVDLGLLQMNAQGRPDGKRPFGHESLLDHFMAQRARHREAHPASDETFRLKSEDCGRLHQEALQYHHRYICLFQMEDYPGVVRDTERNLLLLDFVQKHAVSEDLAWALQQFRPQLILMHIRAKGSLSMGDGKYLDAIKIIEAGIEDLRQFYRDFARHDLGEQTGELQALESWLAEIQSKRPLTEREKLESALNDAVRREDYEKAAQVRDALRNLKTHGL